MLETESLDKNQQHDPPPEASPDDFARQAELPQAGLLAELVAFLLYSKKWWLTPIIVALLVVSLLVLLAGSPLAPFIYPLF
jgi:hypothetical protein